MQVLTTAPHPLPIGEWTLEARGAETEARVKELSEELARTDAPALRKKLDESEKRREKLESDFETTKMQLASAHARNTRERKKAQMDILQARVKELLEERDRLQVRPTLAPGPRCNNAPTPLPSPIS